MALTLFFLSGVAKAAVTWSLPASSSTGSYTITWSSGQSYVEIWENGSGTWIKQSNNGPSGSAAISGKSSGTYNYYLMDCLAGQYGSSCTRTDTRSITVTLTTPIPGGPTSVNAVPSGTSVNVYWSSVSGATSYNILRNGSQIATSGGTAYTDINVAGGASYTYAVQACNGNGCSASTASNAITVGVPTPAAPTSISATYASPSVSISWPAVSGAQTYNIRRSDGVFIAYSGCAGNLTTCTDSNVAQGATYTYQVNACNGTSNCSAYTASPPVTIGTAKINAAAQAMSVIINLLLSDDDSSTSQPVTNPSPTISVQRTPSTPVAGQAFTTSWSTSNATALTRNCTSSGGGFTDNSTLATSGSAAATANTAWVGNPSTCTWTATGPGGSSSFVETVTTISTIPANASLMCPAR
jgi:hypothetical protein